MTSPTETTMQRSDSDEFEFGRFPPDSPSGHSTDPSSSPADHLFSNGRLLPHSFPLPILIPTNHRNCKKEHQYSVNTLLSPPSLSLLSSRSNSVSSSSSSVTTARSSLSTSSSSSSEQSRRLVSKRGAARNSTPVASKVVMAQLYGSSSQRWQHLAPPVRIRGGGRAVGKGGKPTAGKKKKKKKQPGDGGGGGMCRRVLRWLLVTCRECHALEPSRSRN